MSLKRSINESVEKEMKKQKCEDEIGGQLQNVLHSFEGASAVSVLNDKKREKTIFLHGKFSENDSENAVIIIEKKPFDVSTDGLAKLLSSKTKLSIDMKNDIYATYNASPSSDLCSMKATVIYPATEKHLQKYKKQKLYVVCETARDYFSITEPFLQKQFDTNVFSVKWVYNILEHKQEAERILFEDTHSEIGFILLPDMKWDTKDASSLYVIAIPHKRGIKSLRDLNKDHLPLLKNIHLKALSIIEEKFEIKANQLRLYFHYQPSYYHLHVHINHIESDLPGTGVLRAHLLQDVIENIEICSDYYRKKTFYFTLPQNDKLLAEFNKEK